MPEIQTEYPVLTSSECAGMQVLLLPFLIHGFHLQPLEQCDRTSIFASFLLSPSR